MKKSILMWVATIAMVMVSCKENPYMPSPGATDQVPDSMPVTVDPDPTPDPEGVTIPEGTINVYEARKICQGLNHQQVTTEKYYVKGWVCSFNEKHADGITNYGNGTFNIAATNDGKSDKHSFEAYQVYGKNGQKLTSINEIAIGDFVIIYGPLTRYNNTYETAGRGAAYVYYCSNPEFGKGTEVDPAKITPDPEGADVPEGTLTVYEAREICAGLASGATTTEEYYVKGWVHKLDSKHASGVSQYGNGTFYISATNDGTTDKTDFEAYQVYGKNKARLTSADQVELGDFVVLKGKLTNYNGTYETVGRGAAYIYYSTNPKW